MSETGIKALGSIRVICSGDVGGVGISLECDVDSESTRPEIDNALDLLTGRLRRQKAVVEREAKQIALLANRRMLADLPKALEESKKLHAAEEVRLRTAFVAQHNAANRRGEFKLNPAQQQQLTQIASNRQRDEDDNAQTRMKLEADAPLIELQIRRLDALIAGRDPDEEPSLAEAAE